MTVNVTPHLNFRGDAGRALEFYQSVFGGEVASFTYAQAGRVTDPAEADQVVWGQVSAPNGFRLMAYDVPAAVEWSPGVIPLFVSLRGADPDEIAELWTKLAPPSTVIAPLAPSQWAPLYGMLRDPFGITWVLDVEVSWGA
ncbi:VOC family protein [Planococcus sp. APC 4015]|nr:VOC family protein [Planococcus sp. APC 4015]